MKVGRRLDRLADWAEANAVQDKVAVVWIVTFVAFLIRLFW